jgi:hypothetical protein
MDRTKPILLAAALVLAAVPARSAAALNVAEWSTALAAPALAGPGSDAAGRTLTYGHLVLSLATGRLYPVVAADRVVGAFFVGKGSFRYISADPLEAAAYHTNVDRDTSYQVDQGGAIGGDLDSLLIVVSAGAEQLGAGSGAPSAVPPADVTAAFSGHLERFAHDQGLRYTQLMPQAMVEAPAHPLVMAEIVAAKADLAYALDPLRGHDEWLARMRTSRSEESFLKDRRYPEVLSDQPTGRGRLESEPRRFLLTEVDLTLVNPKGQRAELESRETFHALEATRTLDLSLWSTRIGTSGGFATVQEHEYVLQRVALSSGEALPFAHRNGDLVVELPRTLAPGEEITVDFKVAGDVLFNPGNDSYWELPTGDWLPVPDLGGQYFRYHALVKVAKPFTAFSEGVTVRRWEEGELACAEFREDKPIQIPVVLAGRYTTASEERNGLTVRVASYVAADPRGVAKLIKNVFSVIDFYRPYLGDYPFSELKIIEINSFGFGQSPAGVVFITKEAFTPTQDDLTMAFSQGINARLAHEIAHAWWGHVVKLSYQDQWLSESTAEYFSAVAMGRMWHAAEFDRALAEWRQRSSYVKDKSSVYMANALSGQRAWEDRTALLYAKGPLVLDALRKELGDKTFFLVLRAYLKNLNFKLAETRHFIGITNYVAKKDYTDWFNRYLLGTQWPKP